MSTTTIAAADHDRPGPSPATLAAAALLAAALGAAYAPTFAYLYDVWSGDANYSHGFFVVPIALWILWERRGVLVGARPSPRWWGWAALVGVLALRSLAYEWGERWYEDATLPLAAAALAAALGGRPLLRWAWPAAAFLVFMLPLPHRFNLVLAYPLQRLAALASCAMLQAAGLPVIADGNVINVGAQRLEVERACNGLSMLLSFMTLMTAAAILVRRPLWERLVLLASAIPFALAANIVRIGVTAVCYHWAGTDELRLAGGLRLPHDWAGYLMMPIALVLVVLELRLLSWLVVEVEEEEPGAGSPFAAVTPGGYRAAGGPGGRGG